MKNLILAVFFCFFTNLSFSQSIDSSQYYFNKGMEASAAKLYAVAEKRFDSAISFNPQFIAPYIANGKAQLAMRKITEATKSFNKAFELDSKNIEVINHLATLSFNSRQFQKAIAFAKKCVGGDDTYHILGLSYYNLEDYGKAAAYLSKALAKNGNDAVAAYTLGRTYLELGDNKKAIDKLQTAIKIDPERSRWIYELGLICYNQNDYRSAIKYFDMAAGKGLYKTNDFYENYGFAQLFLGNTESGIKTLAIVMERKPNNKELLNNIAFAMYSARQYEKALAYYEKLLILNPNDASSLFMAGITFQKMGQTKKGQEMCDKAIKIDPSLAKNRHRNAMPMGL